jgi:acyl transferase domain-containing protein
MFPGQGSQYINMSRELYEVEEAFREEVDSCSQLLEPKLGLDIRTLLFPDGSAEESARDELTQTVYTQPALFVVEYAMAKLWMSWGIHPSAMVGHSAGEYVAAVLAGVMSLEDGLALLADRARLMQSMPGGGMLSVRMPEEEVVPLLSGSMAVAGVNGPKLTIVSGPHAELDALVSALEKNEIMCKKLHTSHAFHSPMMDPIIESYTELVEKIALSEAQIPIVSTLTGSWIKPGEWKDPSYWSKQLRGAVRFADAVATLTHDSSQVLLEVGPGQTLAILASGHPDKSRDQVAISSMPPIEKPGEHLALLTALGRLWLSGVNPDWSGFYSYERRQRISLPTYPFERKRYWVEPVNRSRELQTPELETIMNERDDPSSYLAVADGGDVSEEAIEKTIYHQLAIMREQLDMLAQHQTNTTDKNES